MPAPVRAYLDATVPQRASVEAVNALNHACSPVAFFASPLTAGLHADAAPEGELR